MNRIRLALARLFTKKARPAAEFPKLTGQWSKPYGSVTKTSNATDVIFIHAPGTRDDE